MRIMVPAAAALMALAVEAALADRTQETAQALAWTGPVPVPLMAAGPCRKPPVLDGKFEPGEWDDASAVATLSHHGGAYAFPSALVYFTYDAERVYFAYPWVVPWVMDNGSPVFPIMNEEWANMPSRWGAVRPVASYRDYMTFNYDFYFRTKHYGGFYIDEAYGAEREDINMLNGSGWLDRAGNLRGSYHAMDVRELFKRQYVLGLKYSPARKPFMLNHTSWGMSPHYMSFVTCGVYVEDLPIGPGQSYLDHVPLSNLQFWSGRPWGHFGDVTGIGPDAKANRYCVGALMLHDVCCSSDPKNRIKAEFGIAEGDVTFYGYWEQPRVVSSSHDAVKASVYRRPGACLVVALNADTRTDQQAHLVVDADALKLPRDFIVLDAETKQPAAMDRGGIPVRLAPRDVRYLYLAPKGWQVPEPVTPVGP
jgi:hypothetical protein